jgi:hypothetical protein
MYGVMLAALFGFLTTHAQSQPLPVAALSQTGTGMTLLYQDGIGRISIDGLPEPALPMPPHGGNSGSGSVAYWIEILGPANIKVPVSFTASGFSTPSYGVGGGMVVTASLDSNPTLYAYQSAPRSPPNPLGPAQASFDGSFVYDVMTNTPVPVQLAASWQTGSWGDGYYGGGSAIVGSVSAAESISDAWYQLGYTLQSSASSVPVPEPATDALMLLGVLLAFVASRRPGRNSSAR